MFSAVVTTSVVAVMTHSRVLVAVTSEDSDLMGEEGPLTDVPCCKQDRCT